METMDYDAFLAKKLKSVPHSGFEIAQSALNPNLFDFQRFIVQKALKAGKYAIFADCGLGKGQPIGSKVLSSNGWINIENLKIGYDIISSEGKIQKVTGVFPKGEINTYRFYFSDGVSQVFDEEHLHICRTNNDRQRGNGWRVLSTRELLNSNLRYGKLGKSRNYDIPVVKPIQFDEKPLLIHPYLLGVLIGDGHIKTQVSISSADEEIIEKCNSLLPSDIAIEKKNGLNYDYSIKTGLTGNRRHPFRQELIDIGLYGITSESKFIPKKYLFNSIENRLELLRGLMDTDGYIKETCQFYTVSEQLKNDVKFLIQSLGGVPTESIKKTTHKDCYVLTFSLKTFNPFYVKRKANKWNPNPRDNGRWIDRIEFEKKQKTVCISVDSPDKSYLTENCIVTHNTLMQLSWAHEVAKHTQKPVLILTPLAVSGQTIQEGVKFGIEVNRYNGAPETGIYISNYEQLENIDCSVFSGVVLDESSILKNFEGATKKLILDSFKYTPYKLACTATPSPNDPMELGNHAEFLEVMSRNEMLAMYFVHDGGETSKWRLKGHAIKTFYQFVGTWSIMLSKPHDIGFTAKGYDLPTLNMTECQIKTPKKENGGLFNDMAISATEFNSELRITKVPRLEEVAKIVNSSDENFIIWIKQNEEGEMLRSLIHDAIEVKGSDSPEYKEKKLLGFANNEFRVLITKTKIAQYGMNYQNCRNQVFASLDFSFEGLYQAIRRSYRFGQKNQVNIYLITTDTMQNVIQSISQKQKQFEIMQQELSKAVNLELESVGFDKVLVDSSDEFKNEAYHIKRGDCVKLIKQVESESVGFSVFSPPFAELYTYSSHIEDMGNCKDYNEFLIQFGFLVKELYRVLMQGRNVAVHCMDLPIQKGKEGIIGLRDFSGMIRECFEKEGFIYHSRITIWKDPVVEMQRTKALGLLHKQVKKDSTMSRVGIPDYVLIFRKDGERNNPVTNTDLPVDLWQKYASPVWMDINYSDTLQGFRNARDERDEKHICPLQLPTIERLIHLYTNKGDTVLTPFMGIGSEVYQAVKMERKGIGFELKESYFDLAKRNIAAALLERSQKSLF